MSNYFFCYSYDNDSYQSFISKDTIKTHSHYKQSPQASILTNDQIDHSIKWNNILRIIDKNCHQINQSIKKLIKEMKPNNHVLINYDEEISKLTIFQKVLNQIKNEKLDVLQKSDDEVEDYFQDFYEQQQELQQQYQQELAKQLNQIYSFIQNYNDVQVYCFSLLQRTQFRQAVYLGPPQQIRWQCWKNLLFSNQQNLLQINNHYQNDLNYNNNTDNFIKQELNKTLQNSKNKLTPQEYTLCQDQLIRILLSTALYLPDISYCQGLNLIAFHMLISSNYDENYAFRGFVQFLSDQKHQFQFCFTQGLPLIDFLCYVIHDRLQEIVPHTYQYLKNISDEIWIKKYIITAFVFSLQQQNIVRFWDYIIVRGALRAIPELIIAIIYQFKDKIMTNSEEDIDRILNKELNEWINVDKIINYCLYQNRFKSSQIRQLGDDYFNKVHKDKIFSQQFINCILYYGDTRYRKNSN